MRSPAWPERLLIAIGCGCVMAAGIQLVDAASFQQAAGQILERRLATPPPAPSTDGPPAPIAAADDGMVGRLEIPRLRMSAVVMEGEDDATLARAVGHVGGTALPWETGNAVLAGHRDTFFRPLRHLQKGDTIRMTTTRGTFEYRVISTEVVDPRDLSVLAPTADRSLTLITCYPFVYVGHAPQRFIVHAR
jgi:sortase A